MMKNILILYHILIQTFTIYINIYQINILHCQLLNMPHTRGENIYSALWSCILFNVCVTSCFSSRNSRWGRRGVQPWTLRLQHQPSATEPPPHRGWSFWMVRTRHWCRALVRSRRTELPVEEDVVEGLNVCYHRWNTDVAFLKFEHETCLYHFGAVLASPGPLPCRLLLSGDSRPQCRVDKQWSSPTRSWRYIHHMFLQDMC